MVTDTQAMKQATEWLLSHHQEVAGVSAGLVGHRAGEPLVVDEERIIGGCWAHFEQDGKTYCVHQWMYRDVYEAWAGGVN